MNSPASKRTILTRLPAFRRETSRRVDHEDGEGWSLVPGAPQFADIEVSVDIDELVAQLAGKAMRSKQGKARAVNGAVLVTALKRRSAP